MKIIDRIKYKEVNKLIKGDSDHYVVFDHSELYDRK